jgi:hypothetical protein
MIIFVATLVPPKIDATARPTPRTASAVNGYSFATPRIPSVPKSLVIVNIPCIGSTDYADYSKDKLISADYAKKYYPQITQISQISKKIKNCK